MLCMYSFLEELLSRISGEFDKILYRPFRSLINPAEYKSNVVLFCHGEFLAIPLSIC